MANYLTPHLVHMTAELGRLNREKRRAAEEKAEAERKKEKSDTAKAQEAYGVSREQAMYLLDRGTAARHSLENRGKKNHGKRRQEGLKGCDVPAAARRARVARSGERAYWAAEEHYRGAGHIRVDRGLFRRRERRQRAGRRGAERHGSVRG